MKICYVGTFPPSGRQLNEYALHVAQELRRDPLISLYILSDKLDSYDFATGADGKPLSAADMQELPGFEVIRCWRFNSCSNPLRLMRVIREINPDVVWFNLVFSSFGTPEHPLAAFTGLCTPALVRMAGYYVHVTLHHLMEHVDFSHAGIRHPSLFRFASQLTTRILLMANSVSVLLPSYRRTLLEKYCRENVHFRAHGILGSQPEFPDFSKRGNPDHRILAIGHWGTYKRLEVLMASFAEVVKRVPSAKLVIAGANHHTMPGYWESIAESQKGNSRVEFLGYVPEEDIPELFGTASILVMPYSSSTGASGPAHQACGYGVPIVSADIPEFRDMAADEDMAVDFYKTGDSQHLVEKLVALLQSPERQREMAEQNFSAALRMTMPQIVRQYLWAFARHQKRKTLSPLARFRRFPSWIPSRSALFRLAALGRRPWWT